MIPISRRTSASVQWRSDGGMVTFGVAAACHRQRALRKRLCIQRGDVHAMLTGGAERGDAPRSGGSASCAPFPAQRRSATRIAPFDRDRDGFCSAKAPRPVLEDLDYALAPARKSMPRFSVAPTSTRSLD